MQNAAKVDVEWGTNTIRGVFSVTRVFWAIQLFRQFFKKNYEN
jgi:hypothetical protein